MRMMDDVEVQVWTPRSAFPRDALTASELHILQNYNFICSSAISTA